MSISKPDAKDLGSLNKAPKLTESAKSILAKNFNGLYTQPAVGLYPHQVLWDSCFVAIGKSHYDPSAAQNELISLRRGQWKNGMVPNIIFDDAKRFILDRHIWRSYISNNSASVPTSGITQPPMIAYAVRRVGKQLDKKERERFYREIIQYLIDYHEWLYKERDVAHDGLVVQIHPWETGLDTTPPWMQVMKKSVLPLWIRFLDITRLEKIGNLFRTDDKYVSSSERGSNVESLALYNVLRHLRARRYRLRNILKRSDFAIADLTFNSILIQSNEALIEIAKDINSELSDDLTKGMSRTKQSFEKFWDKDTQQYYSLNRKNNKLIVEPSVASLMPLFSGVISPERARLLSKTLEDKDTYNTNFPVPSVPISSKWFSPKRYWQGPTWVNINWFIIQGLNSYKLTEEAVELKRKTIGMVSSSGFYEYFNPVDGKGYGTDNFSWTAALIIDLLLDE